MSSSKKITINSGKNYCLLCEKEIQMNYVCSTCSFKVNEIEYLIKIGEIEYLEKIKSLNLLLDTDDEYDDFMETLVEYRCKLCGKKFLSDFPDDICKICVKKLYDEVYKKKVK